MNPPSGHLYPFITAIRRRLLWSRRLRILQKSLVFSCLVALIAGVVAVGLEDSARPVCAGVFGIGAIAAIAWAGSQRVSHFEAARFADERFDLADLLSTAWTFRHQPIKDSLLAGLRAQAESRCRELQRTASVQLIANPRSWAATGLCVLLVICISFWPARAAESRDVELASAQTNPADANNLSVAPPMEQLRPAGDSSWNESSNRPSETGAQPNDVATNQSGSDANSSSTNGSSAGNGIARTSVAIPKSNSIPPTTTSASTNTGQPAGDRGRSIGGTRSAPTGSYASGNPNTPTAAPWQSNSWPAAQAAAARSIQNGRIDPTYLPLVKDYFQQP